MGKFTIAEIREMDTARLLHIQENVADPEINSMATAELSVRRKREPVTRGPHQGPKLTLMERFEIFHDDNPQVYDTYKKLTEEAIAAGVQSLGIGLLTELIRWEFNIRTRDRHAPFKICNDYRAPYARKLQAEYPQIKFTLRTSKADE